MCHCHDTSLTGLQSEDVYQEPGQQCSGMSLLSVSSLLADLEQT